MDNPSFTTTLYAKCILTGEHAVLHGVSAIAFPLKQYHFTLHYDASKDYALDAEFEGEGGENLLLCFWPALEKCLTTLGHSLSEISGKFLLTNTIPIGAGLGFSACVCVAIARWLYYMGWITEQEIFHFAHRCEGLFHGKSSGVDVAAVLTAVPIIYRQDGVIEPFTMTWQPILYASYAHHGSVTTRAVATTEHLWRSEPKKARALCKQMQQATDKAQASLMDADLDDATREALLTQAVQEAEQCFQHWGLEQGALAEHVAMLKTNGAIAVKPTGSGGEGGHVLSLWHGPIPESLQAELLPLFK